ncbi:unnamed protein product [Arctia plantaginis]|uniref:Glycoside hydrolase family 38 central domain-containing protein n=1 Tax=Arctia plantaginis TaxID=874455 RepID=A0A8S1BKU8_ARCPL|nr:unnamed protein product [Arctia plantaginis]
MARVFRVCCSLLIFLILSTKVTSYEKTLRKIVRNQSKMVQRPFSENVAPTPWKNVSTHSIVYDNRNPFSGVSQVKTLYTNQQRPKLSALNSGRSKPTFSKVKVMKTDSVNDRLTRNSMSDGNVSSSPSTSEVVNQNIRYSNVMPNNMTIKNFYQIPIQSKFFPSVDERSSFEQGNSKENSENSIKFDNPETVKDNDTLLVKGVVTANPKRTKEPKNMNMTHSIIDIDSNNEKLDFVIEGYPMDSQKFTYNLTVDPLICAVIREVKAEIDAQNYFANFNIEPWWIRKKHFWNNIFDSRYESLMRNPKWPALKVILVPRVHVDSIWKKTFEQYHKQSVSKILSNVVKKLHFYERLTFSWNEISHLSHWWKTTTHRTRSVFRKLIKGGRLEITTGGWIEPDEATTHIFGLTHQLIEGHQWLKLHLNYTPKVAWLTNSVTHSPTVPYLLSTLDINEMVFTNLHYSWEQYLAEYQYTDFIWLQNWDHEKSFPSKLNDNFLRMGNDRYPKHAVLSHYLQYNSDGFEACGPDRDLCASYNFVNSQKNLDINSYNIKEKAEQLLEQYSKTGTLTAHNTMIAPLGGAYLYQIQSELDFQFNNYMKIADFVNFNKDLYKATVDFGTVQDYFKSITGKNKNYPTLKGDFLNYADINTGQPAYWAGFYTSRPFTKILLRRLQSTLRTTEILFSFACNFNVFRGFNLSAVFELLLKARENVARLLDRNVVSGTVTANVLKYVHNLILATVKDCWYIQELSASFLTLKPDTNTPYLQKYVYRDGEFISVFRSISPGDHIYIFNSMSHDRTEIVDIITRYSNIRVTDHNKNDVTIQINPIWKLTSDNYIKISRKFFKISFAVMVPPMTLILYKIKMTYDATNNAAAIFCSACIVEETGNDKTIFPFYIHPIQSGDIQLESYKHRLVFDELTGFLKTVAEKETGKLKQVFIDYGAFRGSYVNSGMFLFNTNTTKPLHDMLASYRSGNKSKLLFIVSGQVTTELTTIYGRLLQHTTKIFNILNSPLSSAIYIESKVDYDVSPINRELEMFLSIQTDITNGNPPQLFTDNNSFQYTSRVLNISRRIESNVYPITSMVYIQDKQSRLSLMTDHAQGVTALQEGQLVVLLDRRILFDDMRGTQEGLADKQMFRDIKAVYKTNLAGTNEGEPLSQFNLVNFPSMELVTLRVIF